MRILGHIPHPEYHITVFKMENRLSIQFEYADFAQMYKYRGLEQLENLAQAQAFVTPEFLREVATVFSKMQVANLNARANLNTDISSTFDEII
jgi:hypothetical protein